MDLLQVLIQRAKDRQSKRQKHIEEHGVDPKTKLAVRAPLVLTEETRTRGGKNSRRRTARVWRSEQPATD